MEGFPTCYHCKLAGEHLDFLLAPSYSLDNGLESLVKWYKDFQHRWPVQVPLASLLADAVRRHGACLDAYLGADAVHTWVPSDDTTRTFDHIEELVNAIDETRDFGWTKDVIARNTAYPRPGRGNPYLLKESYTVMSDVQGRNVLLLDDLWTSGASMASAAAALKDAGASRVAGLVLGRQLRRDNEHGHAQDVFSEVEARGWAFDDCGIHT